MKTNKIFTITLLLFMLVVLLPISMLGQEVEVPVEETVSFGTFFLGLLWKLFPPILLGALITAANHISAWTMNWKLWFNDTALPALIAYVIALILGVIDHQVHVLDSILESIFQIKTDVNDILALATVATTLVPFIKGLTKREHTKEKVEAKELAIK